MATKGRDCKRDRPEEAQPKCDPVYIAGAVIEGDNERIDPGDIMLPCDGKSDPFPRSDTRTKGRGG